jgi:DNA-binding SARP family transcriptional activator
MNARPPAPVPFELRLLGGFALSGAGSRMTLPVSLQRLTAFLALRGPTSRRTAAGVLWSSTSDDRASASLRTAVWRLRRGAGGLLTISGESLALGSTVSVDIGSADRFSGVHRAAGPISGACTELLPGWYDDWVIMERERLRHWHIRFLESSAGTAIDNGDLAAALDWALSAAAADPLRESPHRLVIRTLLADGNVDAARRHLTLVQNIFREQLGILPSDQLNSLFKQVRAARQPARTVAVTAR